MPPVRTSSASSAAKRQHPAWRACRPCKTHKIACNKQLPCDKCIKKGTVAFCDYPEKTLPRGDSHRNTAASCLQDQTQVPQALTPTTAASTAATSPEAPEPRIVIGARGQRGQSKPSLALRSIADLCGPQVYVGSTAAISFLQHLRDTLRYHAGPSEFTESQGRLTMLEAEAPTNDDALFIGSLDSSRSHALVNHFLEVVSHPNSTHSPPTEMQMLTTSPRRRRAGFFTSSEMARSRGYFDGPRPGRALELRD